jgi:hypothetical protein
VWDPVAGDKLGAEFVPYQPKRVGGEPPPVFGKNAPGLYHLDEALMWHAWVGPDHVLTVNGQTRADVWTMSNRKPMATVPAEAGELWFGAGQQLSIGTGAFGGQLNFALSPDARRLALPRGFGVTIFDLATGNSLGVSPPHAQKFSEYLRKLYGIAYSGDGSKLAYTFGVPDPGFAGTHHTRMRVVHGSTAALVHDCRVAADEQGGIAWWGNDLVVFVGLDARKATVVNPVNGQSVARLTTEGHFRLDGRDGQLWVFFGRENRGKNDGKPNYVCSYIAPPRVKAGGGKTFRITPDGIE